MPAIKVTDQFGVDIDAQPAATSAFLKYFQELPSLRLDKLDLRNVGGLTLDDPAIRSLTAGVSFQDPVKFGGGAPGLSVAAGAHASLALIGDAAALPGSVDTGAMPPDTCYVSFAIDAEVSVDVSASAGGFSFGASPSTRIDLASYMRFPRNARVTLEDAVRQSVCGFSIPAKAGDLADLAPGQIVKAAVTGKLALSGSTDLLANSNPLATADLPGPLPAVSVSAGGSATVGVACAIETE